MTMQELDKHLKERPHLILLVEKENLVEYIKHLWKKHDTEKRGLLNEDTNCILGDSLRS